MRSDAYITVSCDCGCGCNENERVELCSLAGGGWDERYVDGHLEDRGWSKDGDKDFCEACTEERKEQE